MTTPTSISIPASMLRAALLHAGKRDRRYYLNGVYVDPARGRVVATDGHRMYVARIPDSGATGEPFIIPRDALEMALKAHKAIHSRLADTVALHIVADGPDLQIGSCVPAKAVDGRFPQYEQLMPCGLSGVPAALNPDYLRDALTALQLSGASQKLVAPSVAFNGEGPAIVTASGCTDAFVIIMPVRNRLREESEVLATIAHVLRQEPDATEPAAESAS